MQTSGPQFFRQSLQRLARSYGCLDLCRGSGRWQRTHVWQADIEAFATRILTDTDEHRRFAALAAGRVNRVQIRAARMPDASNSQHSPVCIGEGAEAEARYSGLLVSVSNSAMTHAPSMSARTSSIDGAGSMLSRSRPRCLPTALC